MNLSEPIRLKTLVVRDHLGCSLSAADDNRRYLDAAIAWLKHAKNVTGNGGVAHALRQGKLGNSRLTWIRAADLVAGAEAMVARGEHFFDPISGGA